MSATERPTLRYLPGGHLTVQEALAARPNAQVLICNSRQQGERAAELFPQMIVLYASRHTSSRLECVSLPTERTCKPDEYI